MTTKQVPGQPRLLDSETLPDNKSKSNSNKKLDSYSLTFSLIDVSRSFWLWKYWCSNYLEKFWPRWGRASSSGGSWAFWKLRRWLLRESCWVKLYTFSSPQMNAILKLVNGLRIQPCWGVFYLPL